jgi:hypothetical protein
MNPISFFRSLAAVLFLCMAVIVLNGRAALAEESGFAPKFSGSLSFEIQNDLAFSSDDEAEEFNTLFATVEGAFTLTLTDRISVNAELVFNPVVASAATGDDRLFENQGLFVEVLTLNYEAGPLHLSGGKMHVNFANAWDVTPGVFGTDMAEEYEMAENIAIGGAFTGDLGSGGRHTLSAQTFFLDTSGLAESAFTRRPKPRGADGGPGNTGDFSSFAIALDGGEFAALSGFRYHAAYVYQANETVGGESEHRFAVNGSHEFPLTGNITAQPFVEYVLIDDADGTAGQERSYLTAALGFTYGDWNAALSRTFKENKVANGGTTDEEQLQVSVGYVFPNGIGLAAAYKRVRNAGVDTDVFGTLLSYTLEF